MNKLAARFTHAIKIHNAWRARLHSSLQSGGTDLDPLSVGLCDCCDFGRWLHDAAQEQRLGASAHYQEIARLHRDFHQSAAAIVRASRRHDTLTAERLLEGDFSRLSDQFKTSLMRWPTARAA